MKNAISINPLNWKRDETYAPVSKNKGDRLPVVKENEFLPSEYEPQCPGRADAKLDVEKESERKIVDLERTYPLTKYYNF